MERPAYQFTERQLYDLLNGTIQMFFEYRDVHGKDQETSQQAAVAEMFQGLDAEQEMVRNGDMLQATGQIIFQPPLFLEPINTDNDPIVD